MNESNKIVGVGTIVDCQQIDRLFVESPEDCYAIPQESGVSLQPGDEVEFEGWTADNRWNGWAIPYFETQQATKLAGLLEDQLRYDLASDAFIGSPGCEEEIWSGHLIGLPDGGEAKVYAIGAGSWMWDILEEGGGVWD